MHLTVRWEDCAILGKGTKPSPSALLVFWVQMLPPMCATVEDKWDVWRVRTSACCLTMCDEFGWRMLKEKAASNHHYTHLKRAGFICSTSRWEEAGDLFGWTENKHVLTDLKRKQLCQDPQDLIKWWESKCRPGQRKAKRRNIHYLVPLVWMFLWRKN